jgi:hypothetical protein
MATFGCLVSFVIYHIPWGQSTHLDDRWPWTVRVVGWKTKLLDIPNQRVFTVKLLRKFLGIRMYPGSSSDLRLGTRCSLLVHRNISSMKMDVQNMVAAMTKFLGSRNQCQWPIMAPWSWTQATHLSHHCSWTKHVETALNIHTHAQEIVRQTWIQNACPIMIDYASCLYGEDVCLSPSLQDSYRSSPEA